MTSQCWRAAVPVATELDWFFRPYLARQSAKH